MVSMDSINKKNRILTTMTVERKIGRLFRMDNTTWMRHANPWSGILRNTALPALIVAFWSRFWLGWWFLLPVALALLWTWFNPRIFPVPHTLDHWMSKAVLGERVWLNRDSVPVPPYHRKVPNVLSAVSGLGMIFVVWGVLVFDLWPTVFGAVVAHLGKLWFADRMVWLWYDMQNATQEYRSWRIPSTV
jgi:Family of unknown function (DUF6653)